MYFYDSHYKLRHSCLLNFDLLVFRRNIIDSPLCSCGKEEDAYNFFLFRKYSNARKNLFSCLFGFDLIYIIDTLLLHWGHENLSVDLNNNFFAIVYKFIAGSNYTYVACNSTKKCVKLQLFVPLHCMCYCMYYVH